MGRNGKFDINHVGHIDPESGEYVFHTKFDYLDAEIKLKEHFEDGGLATLGVMAGVLGVSKQTVYFWLKADDHRFRPEFKKMVDTYKNIAIAKTDKWHRHSASGRLKQANALTLNRRAEKMLGLEQTINQNVTNQPNFTLDELNQKIAEVNKKIEESGLEIEVSE